MMLLLALIYLMFISLGLPDSLFGAAWPIMHLDFGVDESFASIYMIVTAIGSGGMSFVAGPLIRKFGTGKVTVVSISLTAIGMLIIGLAPHIAVAIVGSIVMGWGAGAIDTGLNSFVSNHYKAHHMNFLHAFWGVGVTVSPLIMSAFLDNANNWQGGFRCVSYIQFGIFFLALLSLPLWFKYEKNRSNADDISKGIKDVAGVSFEASEKENNTSVGTDGQVANDVGSTDAVAKRAESDEAVYADVIDTELKNGKVKPKKAKPAFFKIIKTPGVLFAVLSLGFYTAMEFLIGTWGASYAVNVKEVGAAVAARWVSLYFGGIMTGRVLSGFLSYRLNDKILIRCGIALMLAGMIVFALPIGENALIGLLLIGIGFAPVFPSTIHLVPLRFGIEYSADITGIQMGGSYLIGWIVQLIFGFVAPKTTFAFMPYLLIGLAFMLLIATETTNKLTKNNASFIK